MTSLNEMVHVNRKSGAFLTDIDIHKPYYSIKVIWCWFAALLSQCHSLWWVGRGRVHLTNFVCADLSSANLFFLLFSSEHHHPPQSTTHTHHHHRSIHGTANSNHRWQLTYCTDWLELSSMEVEVAHSQCLMSIYKKEKQRMPNNAMHTTICV